MTETSTSASAPPVPQDAYSQMPKPTTSVEVRERLLGLMRRDLVGPRHDADPDLQQEVLRSNPSTWYLTGFIAPSEDAPHAHDALAGAPEAHKEEAAQQELDNERMTEGLEEGASSRVQAEDDGIAERATRSFIPSSLGITVLLPRGTKRIAARVTWGDYLSEPKIDDRFLLPEEATKDKIEAPSLTDLDWRRKPQERFVDISIDVDGMQEIIVPESAAPQRPGGGLVLAVTARDTRSAPIEGEARELRAVSVFLVNKRFRAARRYADVAYAFQPRIELIAEDGFAPRDDRSTYASDDFDERLTDLHYRDIASYAVGHNVSGDWEAPEDGIVRRVFTNPLPTQEVDKVEADLKDRFGDVERGMERLAELAGNPSDLRDALSRLPELYRAWAMSETAKLAGLETRREDLGHTLLRNIDEACTRIEGGISLVLSDPVCRDAFGVMNRAIAMSQRQRDPERTPQWRAFQLAFILLNLEGLANRTHQDRAIVDLLFFPTGGGKTEAYLGLAAFAIALRRLRHQGVGGAGLSIVMRYTLRLLTLDQLARAAGLVCALEILRRNDEKLGTWPIEIGLWVGGAATPNRIGKKKSDEGTLLQWHAAFVARRGPAPLPLKTCPWCGTKLEKDSYQLAPNARAPDRLKLICPSLDCPFSDAEGLPIVGVDEVIYRRLPTFMIATVDKFANVPWEGQSGAFFGHVDRYSPGVGFFGAAEPGEGQRLPEPLPPIDLIIQDELHLISGPLGTVAALYETAFDLLASRVVDGERRGPKIVASTATVRRAEAQVRALFGRSRTAIFPPPGIERNDSFFARTTVDEPRRQYVGVASPGRGPKLVFLKTLQTLLAGAQALASGGNDDPSDPYLTALCYFNALRELGGARRITDDEVRSHAAVYGRSRVRREPSGMPFADRPIRETVELTSRVSTDDVAAARDGLARSVSAKDAVDVALATNMISVGLDIGRLGLMLVQGQPKTAAEYIQATSRVGRVGTKPGLVIALLNTHKPRDRAHYEEFRAFHMAFYRSVEATSVTPFAPRALDRALAAMIVAAARHVEPALTGTSKAKDLKDHPHVVDAVRAIFAEKLTCCLLPGPDAIRCTNRLNHLLSEWEVIADEQTLSGDPFCYDMSAPSETHRLLQEPLKQLANDPSGRRIQFAAARSMRDTEPSALLKLSGPSGAPI